MNLLNLAIKIGADTKEAEQGIGGVSSFALAKAQAMGQAMYDATKFVAGKAIDMAKSFTAGAIEGYGEYEQLAGGVEKLFGDAADSVIANSKRAYLVAGMSQNQYLEASTSLAANLISSLGGDAEAAAAAADTAMRAIADNADTFGTSVEDVTAVYMSLSKGMYQTLDNLKLGYNGTKEGMEKLIADANTYAESIGEAGDMTIDSYADIVRAIDLIQQKQGLAGTTAKEASTTIQGSLRMAKNAWSDFLTAVGSGDQQRIMESSGAIISAIFGTWDDELGRRSGGIIANVLPVVKNVGKAIVESIPSLASSISYQFTEMIANALGMSTGYDEPIDKLLHRVLVVIKNKLPKVIKNAFGDFGSTVFSNFADNLDLSGFGEAFETAGKLASDAWKWLEDNLVPMLPTIAEYLGIAVTFVGDLAAKTMELVDVLAPFLAPLVAALAAFSAVTTIISVVSAISTFVTTIGAALGAVQSFGGLLALVGTLLGGWIPILIAVVAGIATFLLTNKDARAKLKEIWEKITEVVSKALETIGNFLKELPSKFKTWLGQVVAAVSAWASQMYAKAKDAMQRFMQAVLDKWQEISQWFIGLPSRIISAIGDVASTLYTKGRQFLEGLRKGAAEKWDEIKEWFQNLPTKAKEAIGNLTSVLWQKGRDLLNGFWDGLKSIWNDISSWLANKVAWANNETNSAGGGGGFSGGGGGGYGDDGGGGSFAANSAAMPVGQAGMKGVPIVNIYLSYNAGTDATQMVYDIASGLKLALGGA